MLLKLASLSKSHQHSAIATAVKLAFPRFMSRGPVFWDFPNEGPDVLPMTFGASPPPLLFLSFLELAVILAAGDVSLALLGLIRGKFDDGDREEGDGCIGV